MLKRCTKCKQLKPTSEFYKNKATQDSLAYACKICQRLKSQVYFQNNYERVKNRKRLYWLNNKEDIEQKRKARIDKNGKKFNPVKAMIRRAKDRATTLNLPFQLTDKDIIIPNLCPVLGIPLKISKGKWSDSSPSLDRMIPQLGYIPENVTVISYRANLIKSYGTAEEHRKIADWIDNNL